VILGAQFDNRSFACRFERRSWNGVAELLAGTDKHAGAPRDLCFSDSGNKGSAQIKSGLETDADVVIAFVLL
jgi:hypothetical protein